MDDESVEAQLKKDELSFSISDMEDVQLLLSLEGVDNIDLGNEGSPREAGDQGFCTSSGLSAEQSCVTGCTWGTVLDSEDPILLDAKSEPHSGKYYLMMTTKHQ